MGKVTCPVQPVISFCIYNYMETKFNHHGDPEDYPFKTVLHMELNHTKYQSGTLKWKKIKKPNSREKNLKKKGYMYIYT